jgi:hypothetical protein
MNCNYRIKQKVHLCTALRLCTGRTAHRGSRGIALSFHDHDTRRGGGVSVTPRPLFTPGNRSPDLRARSQSLYRLIYPAHNCRIAVPLIVAAAVVSYQGKSITLNFPDPLCSYFGNAVPFSHVRHIRMLSEQWLSIVRIVLHFLYPPSINASLVC